jgi:hypothetical protein
MGATWGVLFLFPTSLLQRAYVTGIGVRGVMNQVWERREESHVIERAIPKNRYFRQIAEDFPEESRWRKTMRSRKPLN